MGSMITDPGRDYEHFACRAQLKLRTVTSCNGLDSPTNLLKSTSQPLSTFLLNVTWSRTFSTTIIYNTKPVRPFKVVNMVKKHGQISRKFSLILHIHGLELVIRMYTSGQVYLVLSKCAIFDMSN